MSIKQIEVSAKKSPLSYSLSPYSQLPKDVQERFIADLVKNALALKWLNVKKYGKLCAVCTDGITAVFTNSMAMKKALNDLGWEYAYKAPMSQQVWWVRKDGTWPLVSNWRGQDFLRVLDYKWDKKALQFIEQTKADRLKNFRG